MTKQRFQTNLDSEILKKLKITAAEEGTTVNKLIEELVKKYL
ncbi:MAG: hypothetical protein ABF690_10425 [Liquorilactobacillus nagelii]